MHDQRLDRLADVLVGYSTAVKKGDLVRIASPAIALPLVTAIYGRVIRAGGHPLLRLTSEEIDDLFFRHATPEQIKFLDPISKQEVEAIDVHIGVWAEQNTRHMSGVNPKMLAERQAARRPVFDRFMTRAAEGKLRWVGTQFPTHANAQDAEMSFADYADFVFSAGLLDRPDPAAAWREVSVRQQKLTDFLNGKHDYHVVAANGTDVRMSVADRRWINCDGHENFPDGEVFTGPVIDSVEGQINFSFPAVHMGREVLDAKLTFRHGKVVDASASKGEDFLISMLDTDAGSRFLGECAIGTNYAIKRFMRNTLFDEKIGGTVHFAVGAGYPETGNTNQSGLHWDMVVDLRQGGYIEIDGHRISENGVFTNADWPK